MVPIPRDFVPDLESADLTEDGRIVTLAALPRRLLRYLAANRHRFVSKAELLEEVWGGVAVEESSLHQALKQVRHAVGDTGRQQEVIKTASGHGYRFSAEAVERRRQARISTSAYVGRRSLCHALEQRVDDVAAGRGGVILLGG